MTEKKDILSMTLAQLTTYVTEELGQPRFRGKQLYGWLHQKQAVAFEEMTNLPLSLRRQLEERAVISRPIVRRQLRSQIDGTMKFLLELVDGNCIECVLMHYHHGLSLCISTQVGCRMGCKFCASTLEGRVRDLTPGEMLGEVYEIQRQIGQHISTLVLMGMGEPLDNFDNVINFLEILSSSMGQNLSLRHVSLSTCGLVDAIDRLAEKKLGLTLSVSLHAPEDSTRSQIMPVNQRYPIEELMAACRRYFAATGRRISYEYALIDKVNDQPAQARALIKLLKGQNCHVNLIPVNPVAERNTRRSSQERVESFRRILEEGGLTATVRRELGSDIAAACGQLRRQTEAGKECEIGDSPRRAEERRLC